LSLTSSFQPRDYQIKIATSASRSNTLVILPTGLGKTIIAILVAIKRLNSHKDGKILVLAPTKPLTIQHCSTFKRFITLPSNSFAILTGAVSPSKRAKIWESSKLIFTTPQTALNDFKAGSASLEGFILTVFDEAHRCVGDYSYTELAKLYMNHSKHPLILGLTASPGESKERIGDIIGNLFIKRVEARSEEDEDVKPYIEETKIEWMTVKLPEEYKKIIQKMKLLYIEKVDRLRALGIFPKDKISKKLLLESRASIVAKLERTEKNSNARSSLYGSLINQAQAVMIFHAIELIETQGVSTLSKYLWRLRKKPDPRRATKTLLNDERWQLIEEETNKIQSYEHPKLERLRSIIKNQVKKKPDSKIIVFTQYRDTIDVITSSLSKIGLRAEKFVGQSDRVEDKGMDQKAQSEVLERFKSSIFNILISSSIGEEGLHMPDVDLVIFYEAVPSEIRSIQRKGRTGRTMPGRVVILLAEDTVDESYYYSCIYKERRMRYIVSQSQDNLKDKSCSKHSSPTLLDYID